MKKLSLILALIMVFTSLMLPATVSAAPVQANANVVINGVPFFPTLPLLNVDDRLIAPFRQFGETMGAEVLWEDATRRITTLFGNRYSIMQIDSPIVIYGTFTTDAAGEIQFAADSRTQVLEVPPRLVGNNTYIPIRAFAEIVGVDVNWVAQTNTAFITGVPTNQPPAQQPPANQPPANNNNRPDNFGDFSNTSYFRLRTSSAVRNMHQDANNNPFIFVLYDSSLDSSKAIVPNIQDLAQELRFRIYGVDMADTNNRAQDNNWLWPAFFRENQFVDPTVYFVHDRNTVRQIQAPTNMDTLRDSMERFRTEVETGIEFGDFGNTPYFQNRSDTQVRNMIDNNEEFILVLYDSRERDSMHYVPIIKAAAAEREFRVYGLDIDRHPNFHRNVAWLSDFDRVNDLPYMVLVYRQRNQMRYHSQPRSVQHAVGYINEFISNSSTTTNNNQGSQFNDIVSGSVFTNSNIVTLRNLYNHANNNDSFVIFLYDSSNANFESMAREFADAVNHASFQMPNWMPRVYAVNLSSNNYFNQNSTHSNYAWLNMSVANFNRDTPMMVFVDGGNLTTPSWHVPTASANLTVSAFLNHLANWMN